MDDAEFERKMLALIGEAVPPRNRKSAIMPEMRLRDLGLDSIGMLALMFRFEQAFGLDLRTIDVAATFGRMRTVADALDVGKDILRRATATGSA